MTQFNASVAFIITLTNILYLLHIVLIKEPSFFKESQECWYFMVVLLGIMGMSTPAGGESDALMEQQRPYPTTICFMLVPPHSLVCHMVALCLTRQSFYYTLVRKR